MRSQKIGLGVVVPQLAKVELGEKGQVIERKRLVKIMISFHNYNE